MAHDPDKSSWPLLLGSAIICGLATIAGIFAQRYFEAENIALGIYLIAYMTGGWDAMLDTLKKLRKLRLDIHFLMISRYFLFSGKAEWGLFTVHAKSS